MNHSIIFFTEEVMLEKIGLNYRKNCPKFMNLLFSVLLVIAGAVGKPAGDGKDEGGNWKEEDSPAA